ncbi:hypothetical protein GJ700_01400 [Duganella sp. FT92W]|uniref:Carbamoyltransferase C-terminal domain-containing protein n=1 Tax=Pseudoduganella rivuli TaxID=2666085 RepID=A0A7X2IIE0_9BURK|nr:hypothetical protein [Pseudoduganella rivuli]
MVESGVLDVPVLIPPHCGDAGLALGAAWLAAFETAGSSPVFTLRGKPIDGNIARLGHRYSGESIKRAVQQAYPFLVPDRSIQTPEALAREIASGAIVATFNGSCEFGPRALGGRSLLAAPGRADVRERINRELKRREPFRPLAPVLLEENYRRYFEDSRRADAFMLKTAMVTDECQSLAPAIVHVDGSARVQVNQAGTDPFMTRLLQAFESHTGLGVLLNTSFNRRGEPMVESPADAIDSARGLGVDGIYMDGHFYRFAERPN